MCCVCPGFVLQQLNLTLKTCRATVQESYMAVEIHETDASAAVSNAVRGAQWVLLPDMLNRFFFVCVPRSSRQSWPRKALSSSMFSTFALISWEAWRQFQWPSLLLQGNAVWYGFSHSATTNIYTNIYTYICAQASKKCFIVASLILCGFIWTRGDSIGNTLWKNTVQPRKGSSMSLGVILKYLRVCSCAAWGAPRR